ncbi:MAG: hypothetical protein IJR07_06820 [Bacteroidaceae bacterium]|nr:hypothetical protein [Bacteroidaceae bacterium]
MEVCPDELSGDTEPEVAMEYGDTRQGTSQSSLAKQHVSAPQSGSDRDMTACRAWYGIATYEYALEWRIFMEKPFEAWKERGKKAWHEQSERLACGI